MGLNPHEIATRFAPVKTDPDRIAIKDRISAAAGELALLIHQLVPGSREESQAIKAVEIAVHWAHDGIDRRYVARSERKPQHLDLVALEPEHPDKPSGELLTVTKSEAS